MKCVALLSRRPQSLQALTGCQKRSYAQAAPDPPRGPSPLNLNSYYKQRSIYQFIGDWGGGRSLVAVWQLLVPFSQQRCFLESFSFSLPFFGPFCSEYVVLY